MYVFCAKLGVVVVSADDGSILWNFRIGKFRIGSVPSPYQLAAEKYFFRRLGAEVLWLN
jgi:hypothetical protein